MSSLDDFRALAKKLAPFYRTQETTYIAVSFNAKWYLLYSRHVFFTDDPAPIPPLSVITPSIRAGQFRVALNAVSSSQKMEELLAQPGAVTFDEWTVRLATNEHTQERFDRLFPRRAPGQLRLPTYVLESGAADLSSVKDALNLELLAASIPYESLEEVCQELRAPIVPGDVRQSTYSEIILGSLARLNEASELKGGKLSLDITVPKNIEQEKLRLAVKAYYSQTAAPRRFAVGHALVSFEDQPSSTICKASVELTDVNLAMVFVSYDNEFLLKWWFFDQSKTFNQRFQLHRLIDADGTLVKTIVESRDEFEYSVALTLSILGLTILPYGRIPELKDAPDLLAHSASNDLYVVECTAGDIDHKGKLQKLRDRVRSIEVAARQRSMAVSGIYPVIFTNRPREDIVPYLSKLEAFKIAIFCREDIEQMGRRLAAPPTAEEMRATVQALVSTATKETTS
jgi:hypothetical protein